MIGRPCCCLAVPLRLPSDWEFPFCERSELRLPPLQASLGFRAPDAFRIWEGTFGCSPSGARGLSSGSRAGDRKGIRCRDED